LKARPFFYINQWYSFPFPNPCFPSLIPWDGSTLHLALSTDSLKTCLVLHLARRFKNRHFLCGALGRPAVYKKKSSIELKFYRYFRDNHPPWVYPVHGPKYPPTKEIFLKNGRRWRGRAWITFLRIKHCILIYSVVFWSSESQ
jgi:hypothetical protein